MTVITRTRPRGLALLRSLAARVLVAPLAALCLALGLGLAAQSLYSDRAVPGLTVAGVDVGSLDRAALRARLERYVASPLADASVTATYDGREWRTTNGVLGVRPDVAGAVDAAIAYGKSGSVLDQLGAWADALRGDADVAFTLRAQGGALDTWIASVAGEIDREPRSGSLSVGDDGLLATRPVIGRSLDRAALAAAALSPHGLGDRVIALPVRAVYPELDESGYGDAAARAAAVATALDVTADDRRLAFDADTLAHLLVISRVAAAPGDLAPVAAGAIAPATRYRYDVLIDASRLASFVSGIAGQLDRPSVDARYRVSRDGGLSVVAGVAGIAIDQAALLAQLQRELVVPVSGTRSLVAPSAVDAEAFTTADAQRWLPQLQRTSSYTTYFTPSVTRHANIGTGASQFDGIVIKPGQTFSFWQLLGPVTVERGYMYAGAIIANRSDENVIGGGLCQVSTTMFNAVAKLGYQIVERHAHGYLIERYPLGLDAAVFDPGLDFKWKNDTDSPVFLWSWVSDTSVTFEVWGLPTGRTVAFSNPYQASFVDVPPTQAADPAFPAGYAIRGRDVWRTRTVTAADGTLLYSDTFFSHYAPVWGGPAATMTIR